MLLVDGSLGSGVQCIVDGFPDGVERVVECTGRPICGWVVLPTVRVVGFVETVVVVCLVVSAVDSVDGVDGRVARCPVERVVLYVNRAVECLLKCVVLRISRDTVGFVMCFVGYSVGKAVGVVGVVDDVVIVFGTHVTPVSMRQRCF